LIRRVEINETARKQIKSLDRPVQSGILKFLRERVAESSDPRQTGKALRGDMGDLWRYRVGDYRIICDIHDDLVTVLVLRVRHRKEAYRR
jgi:mRNA interferase RelE/StbE